MDYIVTIEGITDLLMHADSVSWADRIKAWMSIPANAKMANVAGDDRSPGFRFVGNFWTDPLAKPEGSVVVPAQTLISMLSSAGAGMKAGKGRSSLKSIAAAGISILKPAVLLVRGKAIDVRPFQRMADAAVVDFEPYAEAAIKAGFVLDVRRAPVGASKHVRVRPRFSNWSCSIEATVIDARITKDVLTTLFGEAGRFKGIGDWRPSSPKKPGPHGVFDVTSVKEAK